jgi:hypothetical protein
MKCTKPSYRCLHLRRNTLEKNHYLFLLKDFDRSKKLSQFTFNGQNFFFWLTPCSDQWLTPTFCVTMNVLNDVHFLFLDYCTESLCQPCVTIHPQSVTLSNGSLLSLSCDCGAGPKPSFQWSKDEEEIPGATFPELVISPVSQDHEGRYTCRVFNNVGTVNSRSANVRITKQKAKGRVRV